MERIATQWSRTALHILKVAMQSSHARSEDLHIAAPCTD